MNKYDEPIYFWLNLKEFPSLEKHSPKLKEIYRIEEEKFQKARDLIGEIITVKPNNKWVKKYIKCIDALIDISSDIPHLKFTKYLDDIDIKELKKEIKTLKTHIEFLEMELHRPKK